ncbi:MAG: hypothetical protein AAGH92_07130 [Planctomycetota bacterium]
MTFAPHDLDGPTAFVSEKTHFRYHAHAWVWFCLCVCGFLGGCSSSPAATSIEEPAVPGALGVTLEQLLERLTHEAPLPARPPLEKPIAITLDRVELHDLDPPQDFPDADVIRRRLQGYLERQPRIRALRAVTIPGTPVLLTGASPAMTLNFELFRLQDLPPAPGQAFYLARIWLFDVRTRRPRWEGIGGPFAWPDPDAMHPPPTP